MYHTLSLAIKDNTGTLKQSPARETIQQNDAPIRLGKIIRASGNTLSIEREKKIAVLISYVNISSVNALFAVENWYGKSDTFESVFKAEVKY